MSIEFFQGFWTFKLDEKRLNKTLGSGRRGCKSSLIRRATLHPHLSDEEVDLRGVLDAQEGEQEEEKTVSLNFKQSCKKK